MSWFSWRTKKNVKFFKKNVYKFIKTLLAIAKRKRSSYFATMKRKIDLITRDAQKNSNKTNKKKKKVLPLCLFSFNQNSIQLPEWIAKWSFIPKWGNPNWCSPRGWVSCTCNWDIRGFQWMMYLQLYVKVLGSYWRLWKKLVLII